MTVVYTNSLKPGWQYFQWVPSARYLCKTGAPCAPTWRYHHERLLFCLRLLLCPISSVRHWHQRARFLFGRCDRGRRFSVAEATVRPTTISCKTVQPPTHPPTQSPTHPPTRAHTHSPTSHDKRRRAPAQSMIAVRWGIIRRLYLPRDAHQPIFLAAV